MNPSGTGPEWDKRTSASGQWFEHTGAVFESLFERSADAIGLYEVQGLNSLVLVDCNQAAVKLIGAQNKEQVLRTRPEDLAPLVQPDGSDSAQKAAEIIAMVQRQKTHRFEWVLRRLDGRDIPVEVTATAVVMDGRNMQIVISRDISERKNAERKLLELTQVLERRVAKRTAIDDTDRKRAENALRESEAKFRALFEGASQGVVLHDESQILEVNPAAVRIFGRQSSHELLGQHPGAFSPPTQPNGESSNALARKYIDECMTKGSARFDWLACAPDGREIPLEVMLTRIEWSGRQVIQAFITDTTERTRTQTALAESEARFSAAFHASPALIGILRVSDGKYVLANDGHLNWLGYPREEVLGRTCLELGMWENPDERDLLLKDMHAFGSIRQRECRWRNRCGERFTVLLSVETIKLNDTPHMLLMALDITQRKRAEEELRGSEARVRESEARFSAAFRASPVFITISRMDDGRYTLANEAFLKWTGYRVDEVLGRDSRELSLWADPADRAPFWEELRRAGFIRERECRVRSRHGQISTMLVSADIIEVNREPHLLTVGLDISQRKQAEAELQRTLARERELSQLKSNFVSMVSHEFRTPLGIIQSSAELLRDFHQRMQSEERADQLESILRNTRRMAGMMEEVLVLSRLDAGKLDFQPAALDLNIFCRRVVDEVLSATNRRCLIELSADSILPDAHADERLLGHIFTNLLSNGVKYSEPGAAVHFAVEQDGHDAVCVVRDCGIGIPEEDQTQLFKAFHRGSNVGTRPGTGLGLLLVKRCAELHGGVVQMNSKTGVGTTVTVRLPVFGADHEKAIGH